MPWPSSIEYAEAIQHPHLCFSDNDLRQSVATLDVLGLPQPCTGNFAVVFKLTTPGQATPWAVKCFVREIADLHKRYESISSHLKGNSLPFMVAFEYLERGIRVKGKWYPILKMAWAQGKLLNVFIREHLTKPDKLTELAQLWRKLACDLRKAGVAHGDLQHGNVMLVPGFLHNVQLKLIDYDGMFVPTLPTGWRSGEQGHPNYQHPRRADQSHLAEVDRFGHLVIYTALCCTIHRGPSLWGKYDNEENLLFREEDFKAPGASAVFQELWQLKEPPLRSLVGHLILCSQGPVDQVPWLDNLVTPDGQVPPLSADQENRVTTLLKDGASKVRARPKPLPVYHPPKPVLPPGKSGLPAWLQGVVPPAPPVQPGRQQTPSAIRAFVGQIRLAMATYLTDANRRAWAAIRQRTFRRAVWLSVYGLILGGSSAWGISTPLGPTWGILGTGLLLGLFFGRLEQSHARLTGRSWPALGSGILAGVGSGVACGCLVGIACLFSSVVSSALIVVVLSSSLAGFILGACYGLLLAGIPTVRVHKPAILLLVMILFASTIARDFLPIWTIPSLPGHTDVVTAVAVAEDGPYILSASNDRTVRVWSLETDIALRRFTGHTSGVTSVAVTSAGRRALSGGTDGKVRLWDVQTGTELASFEGHTDVVMSLAATSDGEHAVSGSFDKTVRLWHVPSGRKLGLFVGHTAAVMSVAVTPDCRYAFSGSIDQTLRQWDVQTGKELRLLEGHSDVVSSLTVTADGRSLLSGSWDKTLRLWDVQTGKELRRFDGHTAQVTSVSITPDGKYAASGSSDKTVRLWDVETGQELHRFEGHTDIVTSVAIMPDGGKVVSGGWDKTVRLWTLPVAGSERKQVLVVK